MRQGHSKNRSRNRGRRPSSSLNRVYESNGPDVKVRGTAQTVADKYLQLARDAQSSGDIVKAESYYQHAEHYLRILAANQPAGQPSPQRRSPYDEDNYDEGDETSGDGEADGDEAPRQTSGSREPEADQRETVAAEPSPQPQPRPSEPRPQPQSAGDGGGGDGGDGWDGHQPDFLRREAQPNGSSQPEPKSKSTRARRERRPRTPQPELAGSEQPQIPAAAEDAENAPENS